MQTKSELAQSAIDQDIASKDLAAITDSTTKRRLLLFLLLTTMAGAILLLDAVLPLAGFWFHTALLTQFGQWPLLPTHLLFPDWTVSSSLTSFKPAPPPSTTY